MSGLIFRKIGGRIIPIRVSKAGKKKALASLPERMGKDLQRQVEEIRSVRSFSREFGLQDAGAFGKIKAGAAANIRKQGQKTGNFIRQLEKWRR